MQELRIVIDECTDDHIILTTVDQDGSASTDAISAETSARPDEAPTTASAGSAPRFRLPITDDLLLLTSVMAENKDRKGSVSSELHDSAKGAPDDRGSSDLNGSAGSELNGSAGSEPHDSASDEPRDDAGSKPHDDATAESTSTEDATHAGQAPAHTAATNTSATETTVNSPTPSAAAETTHHTSAPASTPLPLSPRDIQTRIRAGASIEELAEQAGVPASRIEPFAHPILVERERIAEVARQAYPVRGDGPATLTLWEVLATSFAARGMNLTATTWDSFRDEHRVWHVTVSWQMPNGTGANAPIKTYTAVWSYHPDPKTPRAVAVNSLATELIDPDFGRRPAASHSHDGTSGGRDSRRGQGRRSSVADIPLPGSSASAADSDDDAMELELATEDPAFATSRFVHGPAGMSGRSGQGTGEVVSLSGRTRGAAAAAGMGATAGNNTGSTDAHSTGPGIHDGDGTDRPGQGSQGQSAAVSEVSNRAGNRPHQSDATQANGAQSTDASYSGTTDDRTGQDHAAGESTGFLEFPSAGQRGQRAKHRRRKAVTPHWEDVLLGVRPRKNDDNK